MSKSVTARIFQPPPASYALDHTDVVAVVHEGFPIFASPCYGPLTYLYFHANGTDLGRTATFLYSLAAGLNGQILSVEYPGYGALASKTPSESGLYRAAEALWRYTVSVRGVAIDNIVVWGFSLGSIGACYLAGRQPYIRGVVLQSAFSSGLTAVSRHLTMANRLLHRTNLKIPFSNVTLLRVADNPKWRLFLFRGGQDTIVTADHQVELQAAVPASNFGFCVTFGASAHDFSDADFMEMVTRVRQTMAVGSR